MQHKRLFFILLLFSFSFSATAQQTIGFSLGDLKTKKGEQICVPLTVYGFQQMLSMQYSIQFDAEKLQFVGIIDQNLPYLNTSNFGLHNTSKGVITVVWLDNSLQGVSKNEGEKIYSLCFRVKAEAGDTTEVKLSGEPTPFESVNLAEQLVKINTKKGVIRVQ